jgi:AbiV family abortive infection protein
MVRSLAAVRSAPRPVLAAAAAAAARNAGDLVDEAQLLAESGYRARAVALAALSVEECGKAISMSALAGMPESLRAQAPLRKMLEWHQAKQATGGLIALTPPTGPPGLAPKLLAMPAADLTRILTAVEKPAEEADQLKRRCLYADVAQGGQIREPLEVTEAQVTSQLDRARDAAGYASLMLDPDEQARIVAHQAEEDLELTRLALAALGKTGHSRTP